MTLRWSGLRSRGALLLPESGGEFAGFGAEPLPNPQEDDPEGL